MLNTMGILQWNNEQLDMKLFQIQMDTNVIQRKPQILTNTNIKTSNKAEHTTDIPINVLSV